MRAQKLLIIICFFLSGGTSLMLEVVWSKYLSYFLGNSVYAVASVLAAFMMGLSFGSLVVTHRYLSKHHPILLYGFVQVLIALSGLLSLTIFDQTKPIFSFVYSSFGDTPGLFLFFRFVAVSVLMFFPVLLMGMSLPLVVDYLKKSNSEFESSAGLLYGVNTLGAVSGTLFAGTLLVPWIGLRATTYVAGISDLIVALVALGLWTKSRSHTFKTESLPRINLKNISSKGILILYLFLVSGAMAMIYEIAWFRYFANIFGATVVAFTNMLAVFLVGIALGSLWGARRLRKIKCLITEIVTLELLIGFIALSFLILRPYLPSLYGHLFWLLGEGQAGFGYLVSQLIVTALIVFPVTFIMGALFPLFLSAFGQTEGHKARFNTGFVYAINTIGGVLGSIIGGFFLLPLGISRTIITASIVSISIGIVALWKLHNQGTKQLHRKRYLLTMVIFALMVAFQLSPEGASFLPTSGMFMLMKSKNFNEILDNNREDSHTIFYEEGLNGSVAIIAGATGRGTIGLTMSGKPVAGSDLNGSQHLLLLGQLPALLSEKTDSTMVLGYGTGITTGHLSSHKNVGAIDILEIEPGVIRAASYFDHMSGSPLKDSRTNVILEDGRIHLTYTEKNYDIITSDPISPLVAGATNIYSYEYYKIASARLKKGGIFCQWIQTLGLSDSSLKAAFAALRKSFSHVAVFLVGNDSIVLGSNSPISIPWNNFIARFNTEKVSGLLEKFGVKDPYDLVKLYYGGEKELDQYTKGGPVNTDDNVHLEHRVPFDHYNSKTAFTPLLMVRFAQGRVERLKVMFPGISEDELFKALSKRMPIRFPKVHKQILDGILKSASSFGKDEDEIKTWFRSRETPTEINNKILNLGKEAQKSFYKKDYLAGIEPLKMLKKFPFSRNYPVSMMWLAISYFETDQKSKALSALNHLLFTHPALPEAYELKQKILQVLGKPEQVESNRIMARDFANIDL
ncbi:MAG: fused MFS/spermidine synthase [Bdellovibrionaceae bacterium]|jgi:spermidine synthase|nr:fused MFS/spermidine synthase [Pseudobdellovibrionaceae bacterium]